MRSNFAAISIFLILTARAQVNAEPPGKPEPIAVTIRVNASQQRGQLPPIWRFFGADEPMKSSGEVDLDTILAKGVRGAPDVSALAALDGNGLSILAWHYHDDDVPGPDAEVALEISGLAASDGPVLMRHYRVDRDHSNAYEAWKQMGSPPNPTPDQYASLLRSSRLALVDSPEWVRAEPGVLKVRMTLTRQAVSLLQVDCPGAAGQPAAADGKAPRPKYSPTERMIPARLKAAHEDVQKFGRLRRPLPPVPGLNDKRANLHAHAED